MLGLSLRAPIIAAEQQDAFFDQVAPWRPPELSWSESILENWIEDGNRHLDGA